MQPNVIFETLVQQEIHRGQGSTHSQQTGYWQLSTVERCKEEDRQLRLWYLPTRTHALQRKYGKNKEYRTNQPSNNCKLMKQHYNYHIITHIINVWYIKMNHIVPRRQWQGQKSLHRSNYIPYTNQPINRPDQNMRNGETGYSMG